MTENYSPDRRAPDGDQMRSRDRDGDSLYWVDLSRQARNALSRLLGGGTLRAIAPETVRDLRRLGLIEGDDQYAQLSRAGWRILRSSRAWLKSGT